MPSGIVSVETIRQGCGCRLTISSDGTVIIKPCKGGPNCDVGSDAYSDPDVFLDALRDFFRFGGTLRHHMDDDGGGLAKALSEPFDRNAPLQPNGV